MIRPSAPDDGDDFLDDDLSDEPPILGEDVDEKVWRADRRMRIVKFGLVVVFILIAALVHTSATGRVIAVVFAAAILVWAVRDALTPVRLAADQQGVTVLTGFRDLRQIPWSDVQRVRLDPQARFTGRLLEVDAGESLHFFGRYDLGEAPSDALATLNRIRPPR